MNVTTLSLNHLVHQSQSELREPPLLILLHGIGSNEHDLFALSPHLDGRFLIISARAPITLMPNSYAWFHAEFGGGTPRINSAEAESSRRAILDFIEEAVQAYHADRTRVYLMGFSQGAIMSMSVMLTYPEGLAGVVAMSGRILPDIKPDGAAPAGLEGFPVMVLHGVQDDVLPISYGRASRDYLSTLPVILTYREYPIAHQISEESLADACAWLTAFLDEKKKKQDG